MKKFYSKVIRIVAFVSIFFVFSMGLNGICVKAANNLSKVTTSGMTPGTLTTKAGQQEQFTTNATGGTKLLYKYHLYNYQTGEWKGLTGYQTSPTLNWTFSSGGRYQIMCFVRDESSSASYDAVAYSQVTVIGPDKVSTSGMTPGTLTTKAGQQEQFTTNATGGTKLLYKYHLYNYQTGEWKGLTGYQTSPTLNWTFTDEGKYQVMCFVRDESSNASYDAVAYSQVTVINPDKVSTSGMTPGTLTTKPGQQEQFTTNATGGTKLLYKYHLYNYQTGEWKGLTGYQTSPTLNWTFTSEGRYQVMCFVRDESSSASYDAVAYCQVTVNVPKVTVSGMTPDTLSTKLGQQEQFTTNASGGTKLLYNYHLYNYQTGEWKGLFGYQTSPTLNWTFTSGGRYQIMCFVKDESSSASYDAVAYCEVTVINPDKVSVSGMTPSTLTIDPGEQQQFTTNATGGKTQLLYEYHIYNYQIKEWKAVTAYQTSPTLNWTFISGGSYQVMCFVKDQSSSANYDAVAYSQVTVNIKPVSTSGMLPGTLTIDPGIQQKFTTNAIGGKTQLLYEYHLYNYQTKEWKVLTDYQTDSTFSFEFISAGNYQVMCFVKDESSSASYDAVAYSQVTVNLIPVSARGMTPDTLTTVPGQPQQFTINAIGGTKLLYNYHLYNYQTGEWKELTGYQTNPTLDWTFTAGGNYQVMCFVKDESSSASYDAVAYSQVTVSNTLKGIDVSQWQGTINWASVKSDGVQFAMIRSSYGSSGLDPKFEINYAGAKANRIAVGVYHYSYATSVSQAAKEANFLISLLKGKQFEYPICVDIEDPSQSGIDKETLTQIVITYVDAIRQAGYYPMIYANKDWFTNVLDDTKLISYDHWLAQWANSIGYPGTVTMWQYTSSGSVCGISGNVDMDTSFVDYATKIKSLHLNGY